MKVAALPATAPCKGMKGCFEQVQREANKELLDEGRVRQRLTELQLRYEQGEVEEDDYPAQEKEIMEHLSAAREYKRDEQFEPAESWWTRTFQPRKEKGVGKDDL